MPSESAYFKGERLHPLSIPFRLLKHARTFLVPLLLFFFFTVGSKWEIWAAWALIPIALFETFRYFVTRYSITPTELVVRQGLIFRSVRHIPLRRIQNIDYTQNPLHRMFGVADVRVETAGGAEPEAELKVLSLAQIESLRQGVFGDRAPVDAPLQSLDATATADDASSAAAPGRTILALGTVDLLKLSIVTNRGLVGFAVIAGLFWTFDLDDKLADLALYQSLADQARSAPPMVSAIIGAAALVVLYVLFSIVWTFLNFHGFRLQLAGDDLRITTGLFSRLTATVPIKRIQLVTVRRTILHRWLGVASVIVQTAGGSGDGENQPHIGRRWIAPIIPEADVDALRTVLQPELDRADLTWNRLSHDAIRRSLRKAWKLSPLVLAGVYGVYVLSGNLFVLLAAPPVILYMLWLSRADTRARSWAITEQGVFFREGVLTRSSASTTFDRIQAASEDESPFDRRWRMSTLVIDTAGGNALSPKIRVPYLEKPEADNSRRLITQRVARTELAWG